MWKSSVVFGISGLLLIGAFLVGAEKPVKSSTGVADQLHKQGNYKEAQSLYQKNALRRNAKSSDVIHSVKRVLEGMQRLGNVDSADLFLEKVAEEHAGRWRVIAAVAESYLNLRHDGHLVEGEFHRGRHRGNRGAQYANSLERDRVRSLQLFVDAMALLSKQGEGESSAQEVGQFYLQFARAISYQREGFQKSWMFQVLTDLAKLPDYETSYHRVFVMSHGAPVDENGDVVLFHLPENWKGARNDGERWRWLLEQAKTADSGLTNQVRWTWGNFLHQQFGVQTMRGHVRPIWAKAAEQDSERKAHDEQTGPFAVSSLKDSETIARLASGVKRFELPNEFNFISVFKQIHEEPQTGFAENALLQLATIFENRQQYPKAAQYWKQNIESFGAGSRNWKRDRLAQIVDNWGTFEGERVKPSGEGAAVSFRFRNGNRVKLVATEINYKQLIADVKKYLRGNPQKPDWNQVNFGNIGHLLVQENKKKYLGEVVAKWDLELEPRPNHFDRRISIKTPLQKAGAYFLTAQMEDGNTSRIIVWLEDTAIIKKPLDGKQWYYVADARSGEPVRDARVEFFGYRMERPNGKRINTQISEFAEKSDDQGQFVVGEKLMDRRYQWLITAQTREGRFAYLGFSGIWYPRRAWPEYRQNKVYTITDRPVYRPGQKVKFKFWVRRADYRNDEKAVFAGRKFQVVINNPRNEKILEKEFTADEFGGFDGEIELPDDAVLGVYSIMIPRKNRLGGGGSFRVEEYKKPEYEVSVDAPTDPVKLGDKIKATIRAKYFFGAPVVNARVKYKVERTSHDSRWFPIDPWDWLYGNGYWWFGNDYTWYPGFSEWGCFRPHPIWWHRHDPPELVLENEVEIGPDGTVDVEIDTALAKAAHGDQDHQYTISVEVVDDSRRTILGSGSVLVSRNPFKVFLWMDRGYYRVGDVITANMKAQRLDKKPIQGTGELKLLSISYDQNGEPRETVIETWPLDTNEKGEATYKFKASQAGQYRLSYSVKDAKGNQQEGGYVFLVRGDQTDFVDVQFNDLEIFPEKKTYQPGETVKLLINTNRPNSTVLLFVRPDNGVYLKPRTIHLQGKSTTVDIGVEAKDMPNFFVEAMTLSNANLFQEVKEIMVPPEQRVVRVDVEPNSEKYLPGEEAKVQIKLTDINDEPISGSVVVSVYDRSVEYISGGSNVQAIRDFFWKFRRSHRPVSTSSLNRYFQNLLKRKEKGMRHIGVFGNLVADRDEESVLNFGGGGAGFGGGFMRKSRARMDGMLVEKALPMAAPAMAGMARAEDSEAGAVEAHGGAVHGGGPMVEPTVRKNFADTAYWAANVKPDEFGVATLTFPMPENLTGWKLKAWAMADGTRVGEGEAEVVTAKDVLVRLQAPRFFVEKDEVIISANVHNYLKEGKSIRVELLLEGNTIKPLDELSRTVSIDAQGEARIDWRVKAVAEGDAVITVKALSDADSDAMQMTFPVYVHGMLKTESFTGVIRTGDPSGKFVINVPAERRPLQSQLEIRYSPSLAGAMVDALPYLLDYPYGCTEQTLNRFLPAVVTQNILRNMGLNLEEIQQKKTNLNAQEIGDAKKRAEQWKRFKNNPVYDTDEMQQIVKVGLKRLASMQLSDGGWGWFSGRGERSYPHTTATVVHGLQIAQSNDVAIVGGVLENGIAWLKRYQQEQVRLLKLGEKKEKPKNIRYRTAANNLDALVYMVLCDAQINNLAMQDYLYRDRTKLSVYSLAMLGLALHKTEAVDRLEMVLRNIEQYYVEDLENETAYLKLPEGYAWWYWYGNDIEANAYYLKLLTRTEPKGVKAPRLVKYLLNNRKHSTYWNSTRDTALCIEAMAEYLIATGEDQPDYTLELVVDGTVRKTVEINGDNLFSFDGTFVLRGEELTTGKHTVEFRKTGDGPVYWNAYLTNFTLEDPITAAGLELKVRRRVYKLVERKDASANVAGSRGQVVNQRVVKYDRVELQPGDRVTSGDLLEIELGIDSKNDYEYVILEDFKAAGTEPVDVRSGYLADANGAYVEFRDEKVAFFMRTIPRGTSSMKYRLRAEIPGKFSALPTFSYAMYAPELKANSDEFKLEIEDRK